MIDPEEFLRHHPIQNPQPSTEPVAEHEIEAADHNDAAALLDTAAADHETAASVNDADTPVVSVPFTGSFGTSGHSFSSTWGKKQSRRRASARTQKGRIRQVRPELASDKNACLDSAVKSLDAAGSNEWGMRQRLSRKGFSAEAIDWTIATLQRDNLLDERAFAESLVRRGVAHGYGPAWVSRNLTAKGVPQDVRDRAIAHALEEGDFEHAAYSFMQTLIRTTQGMDYDKKMRKLSSSARSHGHSLSALQPWMNEFLTDDSQ